MTPKPLDVVITDLNDTLRLEKKYILAGNFIDLQKIADRKAKGLAALQQSISDLRPPSLFESYLPKITKLKSRAKENETLLLAAKEGVQSAKTRIDTLINRSLNIGTYGEFGEKVPAPDAGVTRTKLA